MAEAKSRHRPETHTHIANPSRAQDLQADVRRLIREALDQNPGNMPFLIFVDVNLPFSATRPPPWKKEVTDFIHTDGSQRTGYDLLSGLVATNYSWHYEGTNPSSDAEILFIPNQAAKYPLPTTFCDALARLTTPFQHFRSFLFDPGALREGRVHYSRFRLVDGRGWDDKVHGETCSRRVSERGLGRLLNCRLWD